MKIEHKIFEAEVKAFDDENLILEHFISTEHKDRGGDVMRAKGMKIVGKPVVLMLHGRGPMGSEPIAKPLSITVDEFKGQPGVLAKTQYFPDDTGRRLYLKSKGGYMPNWSIGYAVDEAKDIMEAGRFAGRDVTKWQLLEYSPVGVPMNPFAQTVKEFLDKDDAGKRPEIKEESRWFGIVEEKSCTGCGACKKPEEEKCPTCKGDLMFVSKDEGTPPLPCEKCEPEKYAEAMKAAYPPKPDEETDQPCITCGKKLWKEWTKEFPYQALRVYCKAGCEIVVEVSPDPLKAFNEKLDSLKAQMEMVYDVFKKLEPLLKTLPPDPDGGEKGDEEQPDNPPEKKTPPRLVIVREEETPEAKQAAQKAWIIAIAREVISEAAKQEIDRMKGRVP